MYFRLGEAYEVIYKDYLLFWTNWRFLELSIDFLLNSLNIVLGSGVSRWFLADYFEEGLEFYLLFKSLRLFFIFSSSLCVLRPKRV